MSNMMERELSLANIVKRYGRTQALNGLSLTVPSGQVIGIVGPNGAGKSTLSRVLSGEEIEDSGAIAMDGCAWDQAERLRAVAVVHQEPQLFPNLTLMENLLLHYRGVRRPRPSREAASLLRVLGIAPYADTRAERLSLVTQQLTEIARALLSDAVVIVFDEPNSALGAEPSAILFSQMRALAERGKCVVLISHRLPEVATYCSGAYVVIDGKVAAHLQGSELTSRRLATVLLTGRAAPTQGREARYIRSGRFTQPFIPGSEDRPGNRDPSDSSRGAAPAFCAGEVGAVTGPEGGGGREVVRRLVRSSLSAGSFGYGTSSGVAYLPADRKAALFPNMSVAANAIARLSRRDVAEYEGRHRWGLFLSRRQVQRQALPILQEFGVKASHPAASIASLSGGNQQKVALGAALARRPAALALEEPTRGVDIGTKEEIYTLLDRYARSGGAVLMFATEVEEMFLCADKVYVVDRGVCLGMVDASTVPDDVSLAIALDAIMVVDDGGES